MKDVLLVFLKQKYILVSYFPAGDWPETTYDAFKNMTLPFLFNFLKVLFLSLRYSQCGKTNMMNDMIY